MAELEVLSITDRAFDETLQLRVSHGLRTPDALHLATAMMYGCDEFWTNDNRLSKVAGSIAVNLFDASADVIGGGDSAKPTLGER